MGVVLLRHAKQPGPCVGGLVRRGELVTDDAEGRDVDAGQMADGERDCSLLLDLLRGADDTGAGAAEHHGAGETLAEDARDDLSRVAVAG